MRLKRGAWTIAVEVGKEGILAIFEHECRVESRRESFCEYGLARADRTFDRDVPELQSEPMISSRRDAFDDRAGARIERVCLRQRSSRDVSSSSSWTELRAEDVVGVEARGFTRTAGSLAASAA